MGSLKQLVDAECGQANPLVQLSSRLANESNAQRFLPLPSSSSSAQLPEHEKFVREYFSDVRSRAVVPRNFNMQSLLKEVQGMSRPPQMQSADWVREFLASSARPTPSLADSWTRDYLRNLASPQSVMNDAWNTASSSLAQNQNDSLQWSSDYLAAVESKLSGVDATAAAWSDEYMQGEVRGMETDFWEHLDQEWESLARNSQDHEWLEDYEGVSSYSKEYAFQEENPYLNEENPLEEGKRRLAEGELAKAILLLESAAQQSPENPQAWRFLGVAQSENEQDESAISALQKCLQLTPDNPDALFPLATAYANENLLNDAAQTLNQWLLQHPNYRDLVGDQTNPAHRVSSFLDKMTFDRIEGNFLRAAASQPGKIDADLQNALGVLYNLSGNYERAVDSLQTALRVKPEDARLWNRLGATLANGNQSAEAVAAYRRALDSYPAFVRARYNLGIACLNLNSHREAVDHFLSALRLQQKGIGPSGQQNMSDSVWNTLRMATSTLVAQGASRELLTMLDSKDIQGYARLLS